MLLNGVVHLTVAPGRSRVASSRVHCCERRPLSATLGERKALLAELSVDEEVEDEEKQQRIKLVTDSCTAMNALHTEKRDDSGTGLAVKIIENCSNPEKFSASGGGLRQRLRRADYISA